MAASDIWLDEARLYHGSVGRSFGFDCCNHYGTAGLEPRPAWVTRRVTGRWVRRLAALFTGVLLAGAMPEPGLWAIALVGLVPLMYLAARSKTGREAALYAWLGGIGFFMAAHYWLAPKVGPFLIAIGVILGALWIPWALILRATMSHPSLSKFLVSMIAVPSAWVSSELIRSWEHLGGPWGLLGASQWNQHRILTLAELGGVWLVSFFLAATNVALTWALASGAAKTRTAAAISLALLATLPFLYGAARAPTGYEGEVRILGVQTGIVAGRELKFSRHEQLTLATAGGADLVVWGESSVVFDVEVQLQYMARLTEVSRRVGAPMLVNIDSRRKSGGILKSALLVDTSGPLGRYDKMRLVPFGEYIPLRSVFGWIASITEAAKVDRVRGESVEVLSIGEFRLGPLICFESAFPDMARELTRKGADLIVVQSATTTFQESWAPEQHASLAAVRAVETGRTVVHATISGVSSAFDPSGRRLIWFPTQRTGTYAADIPIARGTTPYVRYGDWLPWVSLVITLLAGTIGTFSRRSRPFQ